MHRVIGKPIMIGKETQFALNQRDAERGHPVMDLCYFHEQVETLGITLTAFVPSGMYTALPLTYEEMLVLVKALRQIPAVEQATNPIESFELSSPDLSDLVRCTVHQADLTTQQP